MPPVNQEPARAVASDGVAILDGSHPLDQQALAELIPPRARMAADWLANVVQPNGAFPYHYFPDTDQYDFAEYNEVRHAGTTYSLWQAAERFPDPHIAIAAEKATSWIFDSALTIDSRGAAYLYGHKSKLGGQALALVALLQRRHVTGVNADDDLITAMAVFLLAMELPGQPGRYYPHFNATTAQFSLTPDSHYYPGEALLALTRLAEQFPDGPWLTAAKQAAQYLLTVRDGDIVAAGQVPRVDHWLTIALADLYHLDPDPTYRTVAYLQADNLIANQYQPGDPDPSRIGAAVRPGPANFTASATRAEALLAATELARFCGDAEAEARFLDAALRAIQFSLRSQNTRENSSKFPQPERVVGGWSQDSENARIRIDFVQHNLAALLHAHNLLTTADRTIAVVDWSPLVLKIAQSTSFDGPSVWGQSPVTYLQLQVSATPPASQLAAMRQQLASACTRLDQDYPLKDQEFRIAAAREDDSIAALLADLISELQLRFGAGSGCTLGPDPAVVDLVCLHHDNVLTGRIATVAIDWLVSASSDSLTGEDASVSVRTQLAAAIEGAKMSPANALVAAAARRRGIPVEYGQLRSDLLELGDGAWRKQFAGMKSSLTPLIGAQIAGNKHQTNQLLRRAGLPVPEGELASSVSEAIAIADGIGYPVVLKPAWMNKGKGVFVNLGSQAEIAQYFPHVSQTSGGAPVLVERFITGVDYRVVIIGDKLGATLERTRAQVTGDGVQTIQQLIDQENRDPRRSQNRGSVNLRTIEIDLPSIHFLERQGLSLASIPGAGQQVVVRALPFGGGFRVDRTADVHPDNVDLARQATRLFGLDIAGLDIVTPNISESMWQTGGVIIEVNSGPSLEWHMRPHVGQPVDLGETVVDYLFPAGQPVRVPVIAIAGEDAGSLADQLCASLSATGIHTGMAANGRIAIDGVELRQVSSTGSDGIRMLLHNPMVECTVVEVDASQIAAAGLGFSRSDIVVITSLSGATTPYDKPVESVIVETLASSGTLVLSANEPELEKMASLTDRSVLSIVSNTIVTAVHDIITRR